MRGGARVTPTTMKKALSTERAFVIAFLAPSPGDQGGCGRIQKGFPFNWRECFHSDHSRNPEGSNGGTGRVGDISDGPDFFKANIAPGARWTRPRPNGPGNEGQPVLIQPSADGSMHVIGGAGGTLNYLKLRGVKDASDYKGEVAKRAAGRSEEQKMSEQLYRPDRFRPERCCSKTTPRPPARHTPQARRSAWR